MILSSLLAAGALSLRAAAFLVVPEVDYAIASLPDAIQAQDTRSQKISLACTECPFPEVAADGKVSWTDGFDTSLELDLSVENDILLVNNREIFPPPPPPLSIDAIQRRISDGQETGPIPLGFALEVVPLVTVVDEPGPELFSVRFTVLDLAGHPVPLNTVVISVVKDESGALHIAKTDMEEATPDSLSWRQCRGKPKCLRMLLFARIRALMGAAKARMMGASARLMGSKGCHGGPHRGPPPAPFSDDEQPPFSRHGGPPHRRPHHGGRPHYHMHHSGWERTFSRVVRFIVVPAVLGVLAGLAASAVGMLVGQVIVFLWLRYRRSGTDRSVMAMEQGSDMEKEALMTQSSDDFPPEYNDEDQDHAVIVLSADQK